MRGLPKRCLAARPASESSPHARGLPGNPMRPMPVSTTACACALTPRLAAIASSAAASSTRAHADVKTLAQRCHIILGQACAQQKDRLRDASCAQLLRLIHVRHPEHRRDSRQRLRDRHRAMPIGVRLDHGEQLTPGPCGAPPRHCASPRRDRSRPSSGMGAGKTCAPVLNPETLFIKQNAHFTMCSTIHGTALNSSTPSLKTPISV